MTKSLCFLLALCSANCFATQIMSDEKTFSAIQLDLGNIPTTLKLPGIYKFESAAELLPKMEYVSGVRIINPERETVTFNSKEPVAVSFRKNGDALIQLLLTDEEIGQIPEAIVLDKNEFDRASLKFIEAGGLRDLTERYSIEETYQEARRGRGGFSRRGRAHYRNAAGGSYYGCVASVCAKLGGCTGTVGNGRGMTNYLRKQGWHSSNCHSPKVGDVASWTGGSHGKGHTGMWNGRGWCYDLGCADPGSRYHLLNCVSRSRVADAGGTAAKISSSRRAPAASPVAATETTPEITRPDSGGN